MIYNEKGELLYTTTEAAAMIGRSLVCIQQQAQRGRLVGVKGDGGRWLFTEAAIEEYRDKHKGRHGAEKCRDRGK